MEEISHVSESFDEMDEELAFPFFKFHPTDEDLFQRFRPVRFEDRWPIKPIRRLYIDMYDPWELPSCLAQHSTLLGNVEWYFFCNRNSNCNRTTKTGFWEATGFERAIYSSNRSRVIGLKSLFTFHYGHTAEKSIETGWFMEEFRLPDETDSWVICKIIEQRGISHNCYLKRMYEHDSGPQEDCISRRMSNESNLNNGVNNGGTEEPYYDSHFKRMVEDNSETCIDINDHPGLATANIISPLDPNQSSNDFFYVLVAIILALTGQSAFTFIGLSTSSTLNCVGASTVVGFIGSLSAMLLRYKLPKVARYIGKVSVVIGAAAVVSVYAARFHQEITWTWGLICGIALLIPSVAVLFA